MKFILPKSTDKRFAYLATKAKEAGFDVLEYTERVPAQKGVFLFPLGANEEYCLSALSHVTEQSIVFVGKATEVVKAFAKEKNIRLFSLLERERYLTKNAEHTAEGALAQILAETDRRLDELCFLIYGYGNCGRAIARSLWLCGAEIWVWSRRRGQALAARDGFNVFPVPEKGLGMFDGVINTVPDPIFSTELLSTMQPNSIFFQIASGFSGIDPKTSEQTGIRFVPLHGLPGKFCPASDADAIWEEIEHSLTELSNRSTL
ncbi:MAG: hypothetical protein IJC26_03895 [Clostridia bacterium]|nr:hypothetical protein [Clostridia bacterium]